MMSVSEIDDWARVFREREILNLSFSVLVVMFSPFTRSGPVKNLLKFNSLIAYRPVKICKWSEPSVGGRDIELIIAARLETWDLNV